MGREERGMEREERTGIKRRNKKLYETRESAVGWGFKGRSVGKCSPVVHTAIETHRY